MRQTLLHIPHQLGPLPLFGLGWMLILWGVFAVTVLLRAARTRGRQGILEQIPFLAIVAVVIAFVLPRIEERALDGTPLGLPIRGYGVMLLLGVIAGVATAAHRGQKVGLHPELIFSLAFWMFLFGIAGARLFFLVQYWPSFRKETLQKTLFSMLNFTEGGLVVYGSVIGALLAAFWFFRLKRLPVLAMADLIAPSMALGLAIGRIGCLLNGCCFGGVCEEDLPAIRFPAGSPPYMQQLHDGHLLGLHLNVDRQRREGRYEVREVHPNSLAAKKGITPGTRFDDYIAPTPAQLQRLRETGSKRQVVQLISERGHSVGWTIDQLPSASLPVHPAQIYASINAFLLFNLLWFLFPVRRRNGVVFSTMLTLYPVSRILEEIIRSDEQGQLGTALTISQWISVALLLFAVGLWMYIWRNGEKAANRLAVAIASS